MGTSETIRPLSLTSYSQNDRSWNEWLAGLIDGDGSLLISKAGYASCEITMSIKGITILIIYSKLTIKYAREMCTS